MTSKSEIEKSISTSFLTGYKFKSCEHCGQQSSSTEHLCSCQDTIDTFGCLGCSCCGISYYKLMPHTAYIDKYGKEETYHIYQGVILSERPCKKCVLSYRDEFQRRLSALNQWKNKYASFFDDNYEEPCRAHKGYCSCCGGCPRR